MITEDEVVERLRELAGATQSRGASPDLEQRLLASFPDTGPVRRASGGRWWPAIAASVALAVATTALVWQTRPISTLEGQPNAFGVSVAFGSLEGFVPVPGAAALPQLESGSVVRYEMPLTTLRAYGLDIVPEPTRPTVDADLLIGQDGYARAIRLLQPTEPNEAAGGSHGQNTTTKGEIR